MIEEAGLKLFPGGCCLLGPTLLVADPLLGSASSKRLLSDHHILRTLSLTLRQTEAVRLVILGNLFASKADSAGDLPGLLVPWRGEILDVEIAWVYAKPEPKWDQILDFLEVSRIATGAKLGGIELLSAKGLPVKYPNPALIGGLKPWVKGEKDKKSAAWATYQQGLVLPSCRGAFSKSAETYAWDWTEAWQPLNVESIVEDLIDIGASAELEPVS